MNLDLLDRGSIPIHDSEIYKFINQTVKQVDFETILKFDYSLYSDRFYKWLTEDTYNYISGLEKFPYSCYSHGSSAGFGEFISRHPSRRIRASRSDFILTKILCQTYQRNYCALEDDLLTDNDCLIVSLPFSGNGTSLDNLEDILNLCDQLGIPVLIDASYYGIGFDVEYNLDHSCITDFLCSLSKNYYCNDLRVGIRFTKIPVDDGISASLIMANTFNKFGGYIGHQLLNTFSHQWFINRYKSDYIDVCHNYNLTPTQTITMAIGSEQYKEFTRGDYVRVCVSRAISK